MNTRVLLSIFFYSILLIATSLQSEVLTVPKKKKYKAHCYPQMSTDPFPTEFTFRDYCDHELTWHNRTIDTDDIKAGDTIFVSPGFLGWFADVVHPKLKNQYILVTGERDHHFPTSESNVLLNDPKLGAWFTRNLTLSNHPKLIMIPYGQTVAAWGFPKELGNHHLKLSRQKPLAKKKSFPLVYLNISLHTHGSRSKILDFFKAQPYCFAEVRKGGKKIPRTEFLNHLSDYKFTIAPRGFGWDTVRFWEAVGLNTIPIYKHSPVDELYEGTPSVVVDSWDEVTNEFLLNKYYEILGKIDAGILSNKKAFWPYWKGLIDTTQNSIKNNKWTKANIETTKLTENHLKVIESIITSYYEGQSPNKDQKLLLITGKHLGIRPLQIAKKLESISNIYMFDPYILDKTNSLAILEYVKDPKILNSLNNLDNAPNFVEEKNLKNLGMESNPDNPVKMAVFLDLTHYRYQLSEILANHCKILPNDALIFGNMADNPYVKKQLEKFSINTNTTIHKVESFWYFTKP